MLITVIFWLWPKNPLYWHFWISDFKFLNEILPTSAGGSAPRPPLSFLAVSQYWPKFQLFFVPFSGVAAWTTAAAGTWKRRTLNTREMADFSILFELVLVRRFVAWKWVCLNLHDFFYILTLTLSVHWLKIHGFMYFDLWGWPKTLNHDLWPWPRDLCTISHTLRCKWKPKLSENPCFLRFWPRNGL